MVASPAPDILEQCPDAFLGLQWWKPTPGALPRWTWVKPCSQGSSMATCSPSHGPGSDFTLPWIGFAIFTMPVWMRQLAITSSGLQLTVPSPVPVPVLSPWSRAECHSMGTGLSLCLLLLSVIPQCTLHREKERWPVMLMLTGFHGLHRGRQGWETEGKAILDT